MTARRVTVVGDGVVGRAVALELARSGWRVELAGDGDGVAGSASAVAAGMLAPASEALLDGMEPQDARALTAARRRWDAWSARLEVPLDTSGALHTGDELTLCARADAAAGLGLHGVRRDGGLEFADDAVLDPRAALARLAELARDVGVTLRTARAGLREGRLELGGYAIEGEVVVAAGWGSAALAGAAPELAALQPIKGQLLRFFGAARSGPVIRAPGVYLAPGVAGWTAGATMEPGRSDLAPDPAALSRLRAAASAIRPELADAPARAEVGVRAAAPDGRPLVGRSRTGVWLATGMRRNGWLLAPLVAEGIAAYLAGADADAALAGRARAWDPARVFERGWA